VAEEQLKKALVLPGALKINSWYRAVSVVLGLAGLGAGGAAVYLTHLEAGPVALLVVGLLMLLIGMAGQLPSRIRIGDNEAEWRQAEAGEIVERIADRTPSDEQQELIADLRDLAKVAPQVASPGLSAVAYQQLVTSMIYDSFVHMAGSPEGTVGRASLDGGYDMQLTTDDRTVAFVIKYTSKRLNLTELAKAVGVPSPKSPARYVPIVLVTNSELTTGASAWLERDVQGVYVAVVRGSQDRHQLFAAVTAARAMAVSVHYFIDAVPTWSDP
jgi:hypothetical protein